MREKNPELEQEINLRDYIDVIIKRKKVILSIFFASVILASIASFMMPKVYQGTALIMITPSRVQNVLSLEQISLAGQKPTLSLETHKILMKSTVVINRIIDELQLVDGTGKGILPENLSKQLNVKNTKDTNILQLNAMADSPKRAQELANTWAQEYERYNQALITGEIKGTGDFVAGQFEIAKQNLIEAEEKVNDFKDKYKVDLMKAELDMKKTKLNESKKELMGLEIALKTKEDSLKELKKEFAKQEKFIVVSKAITDDALWQKSSKEESAGDLDKKKLKSEEINPIYRDLETRIVNTEIELNTLRPKFEYLKQSVISGEKEINELEKIVNQKELELVQLNRQVEIYKKTYDNLSNKIEDARIAKTAQLGDVKIVSPATESRQHISPNKRQNVIFAGMLSLMLGVFLAFFMEFLEKSKKV